MRKARWVELELRGDDSLAAAIYHICAFCGEQRIIMRWAEEGSVPTFVGTMCPHLAMELESMPAFRHLQFPKESRKA